MPEIETHSAAWHYSKAEEYLSRASFLNKDPDQARYGVEGIRLVNESLQRHYVATAAVHAELARVGAIMLAGASHSPARATMIDHAEGKGVRDR